MAEFNELANTAMEIVLLGKSYKVRRLPMDTIFGKSETAVLAMQMKRIHMMADTMEGEDKSSFLAKAMLESLPTGRRLNDMTASFLRSVDGVKMVLVDALKKDQPDIEKEIDITELISLEPDKISSIISFCMGRAGKPSPLANGEGSPQVSSPSPSL